MIDLVKELLGIDISDTTKDNILNFYITKAENVIKNYLNYSDEEWTIDKDKYENQIIELTTFYYRNRDTIGITQMSQGSRSMTIESNIPQSIKDSLPLPRVKVVG